MQVSYSSAIDKNTEKEQAPLLPELSISHSILSIIPYNLAIEYLVLPTGIDKKGRLEVLMVHPDDPDAYQKLQMYTAKLLKPKKIDRDSLLKLIAQHYGPVTEKSAQELVQSEKRLSINLTASAITIVDDICDFFISHHKNSRNIYHTISSLPSYFPELNLSIGELFSS